MKRTVEERAWGFSEKEYIEAFGAVYPRSTAESEIASIFSKLSEDQDASIGGEDFLFALLSTVSNDCRRRVQLITGWSNEELQKQQDCALKKPPQANPSD